MPSADAVRAPARTTWYRQPIVWLGVTLFVASLAGCVWIIVVASHHPDAPVEHAGRGLFGVPSAAHSSHGPPPASSR
jgi:hypothetical protein